MIKYNKIIVIAILTVLVASFGVVHAQESVKNSSTTAEKVYKAKTTADKQLDQRIENLERLKDKVNKFKNVSDNDKSSIMAIVDDLISKLTILRNTIETATSTDTIKEVRSYVAENYRVYALLNPELNIIASADRINTMISMMSIVGTKLEARLSTLATSSDITSANITSAAKALVDLKSKLVSAQTNVQESMKIVQPLMPDQGDKAVMESNQKALKDARAKIKLANNDLIGAKKDVQTIMKILEKEKKVQKEISNNSTSTPATTTPIRTQN